MNKQSLIFMRFYRLANMTRDCLMFLLQKNAIDPRLVDGRGQFFKNVLEDPLIVDFFEKNGENGTKFANHLNELYDNLYGTKMMINFRDEEMYMDDASKLKLFDYIIGIYQSTMNLLNELLKDLKSRNEADPRLVDLLSAEDQYYRSLMLLAIFRTILERNRELKENIKETKGQPSPTINFIIEELKKLVQMMHFVKQHDHNEAKNVELLVDSTMVSLKFLDGTIKSTDPKEIEQQILQSEKKLVEFVQRTEKVWFAIFKEIIDEIEANQGEQTINEA